MLDDIWHYAGDRSTDFNWYTKRGILAAVYCSTGRWACACCHGYIRFFPTPELYMTQDNSVDFQDTWSFMARRFEDTKRITISRYQFDELMSESLSLSLNAATTVSYNYINFCLWVWLVNFYNYYNHFFHFHRYKTCWG